MTARALTIDERNRLRASIGMPPLKPEPRPESAPPLADNAMPKMREHAERQAICPECGVTYTQVQLSPEWCAMATKHDPQFMQKFPDGWTPDLCPTHTRELIKAEADYEERRKLRTETERHLTATKRHPILELERPRQAQLDY